MCARQSASHRLLCAIVEGDELSASSPISFGKASPNHPLTPPPPRFLFRSSCTHRCHHTEVRRKTCDRVRILFPNPPCLLLVGIPFRASCVWYIIHINTNIVRHFLTREHSAELNWRHYVVRLQFLFEKYTNMRACLVASARSKVECKHTFAINDAR